MNLVTANKLSKVYGSGNLAVTALNQVSFEVGPGEFVAVMGPSGCGKSTLLHLMGGLDRPTGGTVSIDGASLSELNDNQLTELRRRKIGFIFQFFNLIPTLTVLENVMLPLELNGTPPAEAEGRAKACISEVGLQGREATFPDRLSGGEQQRVAIARALVHEPALILADEPTGNLDEKTGRHVMQLLDRLTRQTGKNLILVTHSAEAASFADRILFLRDGKLVEETS
jgi:putative ABC transport system ATP-binding protein